MPNNFDPGLGTAWRYGNPVLATRPQTGNTGLMLYWRYANPLRVFTLAPTVATVGARLLALLGVGT